MQIDFPCKCGHLKIDHIKPKELKKPRYLGTCYHAAEEDDAYYADNCYQYVPDNLRYLEQLSGR